MKTYFCSSDIHSFYTEWMIALKTAGFDITNCEHIIIVCGDLFDRGSESLECYNFVKQLAEESRLIYIRGNHEDLLFDCVDAIKKHKYIGSHHQSNGTVSTVAQMMHCSPYDVLCHVYSNNQLNTLETEFCKFIDDTCVDFFELHNTVFVHGWVPTTSDEQSDMIVDDNWRDGDWNEARWENGMEMFKFGIHPKGKTVVCGHWHTSYGHKNITKVCSTEFGPDACFDVFIQPGIVALDGCTAYTHNVNVVKFDEDGNVI